MTSTAKARSQLSRYKWKRLGNEALINALRLLRDATILYNAGSYPSAYQLAVLSLEELSKACWVEHYYYSSLTNTGFPDVDFEQEFLKLLYLHNKKQMAFIAPNEFEYPLKLVDFVNSGGLERRKQQAVYVGFDRDRKTVHVTSRISVPIETISQTEAKRLLSWINSEFLFMMDRLEESQVYFGLPGMDEILRSPEAEAARKWPHRSRTRSRSHYKAHLERHKIAFEAAAKEYVAKQTAQEG